MMIETINKLCSDGIIKELHQAGFISQKLFTYKNTYNYFAKLIIDDYSFTDAVKKTAKDCKLHTKTVYQIIKTLK